jgi:diaminopimelate epimerase
MKVSDANCISFFKVSGSGNDFIIIDNRDFSFKIVDLPTFVRKVCQRKISVGADGLFLIEPSETADFKWRFFNADGSAARMCGNGSRCVARYAYENGMAGRSMSMETPVGVITADVFDETVKVRLPDPSPLQIDRPIVLDGREVRLDVIDTGVPHAVVLVEDLDVCPVFEEGRKIRLCEAFHPEGVNADFARVLERQKMRVRTYERGVEDETLACGTGVVASVLAAAGRKRVGSPVDVTVQSGETLRVYFKEQDGVFREIYLEGKVKMVYQGLLFEEAYK